MNLNADQLYQVLIVVQEFFAAVILAMFYLWLRRRQVKDPSLFWLCLSLLSWSVAAAIGLAMWNYPTVKPIIPFICSPVSSILITMTAFRFSRVQEVIHRYDLQWGTRLVNGIVIAGSATSITLLLLGGTIKKGEPLNTFTKVAINVDATVSSLALLALAVGLIYSFFKYKNFLLIALTILDLMYIMWRQFYLVYLTIVGHEPQTNNVLAAFNIASYSILTMIFISLAVAWSLSDASRLKRVGVSPCVDIIALIFDLRGSTEWHRKIERENHDYAGTFMDDLLELGLKVMSVSPFGRPTLVKYLGDGYLFVWELKDSMSSDHMNAVIGSACTLYDTYPVWSKDSSRRWAEAPPSIGVGVDCGCAKRHTFENGSVDYQGSPVNNAAKMQSLARPDGGVLIRRDHWEKLPGELFSRFPGEGDLLIGNEHIRVRATKGVVLPGDDNLAPQPIAGTNNGNAQPGSAISLSPA